MKRILLFTLLISFLGYSQDPIQSNILNFDDDFSNDLTESTNSSSIDTDGNGFLNIFPTRESNTSEPQSYQRLQQDEMSYRLFHYKQWYFNDNGNPQRTSEKLYDDNGNVTLEITDNWDVDTQSYIPSYKNESTYDENGNLTLYISNYWDIDTQSYIPSYKNESTYDENGNLTLYITNYWDIGTQSYIPSYKNEYNFDENDNLTLQINYYSWDVQTQSFIPNDKIEYDYDDNSNNILSIYYFWDYGNSSFVINLKSL